MQTSVFFIYHRYLYPPYRYRLLSSLYTTGICTLPTDTDFCLLYRPQVFVPSLQIQTSVFFIYHRYLYPPYRYRLLSSLYTTGICTLPTDTDFCLLYRPQVFVPSLQIQTSVFFIYHRYLHPPYRYRLLSSLYTTGICTLPTDTDFCLPYIPQVFAPSLQIQTSVFFIYHRYLYPPYRYRLLSSLYTTGICTLPTDADFCLPYIPQVFAPSLQIQTSVFFIDHRYLHPPYRYRLLSSLYTTGICTLPTDTDFCLLYIPQVFVPSLQIQTSVFFIYHRYLHPPYRYRLLSSLYTTGICTLPTDTDFCLPYIPQVFAPSLQIQTSIFLIYHRYLHPPYRYRLLSSLYTTGICTLPTDTDFCLPYIPQVFVPSLQIQTSVFLIYHRYLHPPYRYRLLSSL